MSELISFIGWVVVFTFFIWFGCTLSSINSRLGVIAGIVAESAGAQRKVGESKPCPKCATPVPMSAVYCSHCGGRCDGRAIS